MNNAKQRKGSKSKTSAGATGIAPAFTIAEAIGVFERAFRARNPREVETFLREALNVQVGVVESKDQAEMELRAGRRLLTVSVPYDFFLGKVRERKVYRLDLSALLQGKEALPEADEILPNRTYVLLKKEAGYSHCEGLTFEGEGEITGFADQDDAELAEKFTVGRFQTWQEHAEGVWVRSQRLAELYKPFIKQWTQILRVEDAQSFTDTLLWSMRVGVLLHDVGKLREDWQHIVWENERILTGKQRGKPYEERFIARTSRFKNEVRRHELLRAPHHASYAYPFVSAFLRSLLGEYRFLESAISLATARHHSLEVSGRVEKGEFTMESGSEEFLQRLVLAILKAEGNNEAKVIEALRKAVDYTREGSEADEPPSPTDDFYLIYCLQNRMVKMADWEDAANRTMELPGYMEATGNHTS